MSSHFARLKEELDAKQHELQEEQATVESIEKLTKELEAQKKALLAKSEELRNRQDQVKSMQNRLNALTAVESAVDAAMNSKSSTQDVLRHVIEQAIRSDHLSANEIVKTTLNTAMDINGRSRSDNLCDLFVDLVDDDNSLQAAIEGAMTGFANVNEVVACALGCAMENGANAANLEQRVIETVHAKLGKTPSTAEFRKKAEAALQENTPSGGQSQATPIKTNALRGQAKDFKPASSPQPSDNGEGWQAFARAAWANGVGNG